MSDSSRSRPRVLLPRASLMVAAALIGIGVSSTPQAQAATLYWDAGNGLTGGTGGSGNWDTTSASWSTTAAGTDAGIISSFSLSDTAIFAGTAGTATLTEPITIGGLVFSGADFAVTGDTLTLAAASGAPSISVATGYAATLSSIVAGTSGLTKAGDGLLKLTNVGNTYTGTTTISRGTLVITSNDALGDDTSAVVVTGSATRGLGGGSLVLDGTSANITLSRNLSLQGYGPITDRSAALVSVGNNTLTGVVTTAEPTAGANVNTRITSAAGMLTFGAASTFNVQGTAGTHITTLGGTNQAGAPGYTLAGVLTGTGTLEKSGSGTLFLTPSSVSGFSGRIRVTSSATTAQSSVRITSDGVLGTGTGTTTSAVLDLNGGILEVLMDTPFVRSGSTPANANVYLRTSSTIFADHATGSAVTGGTLTFGALSFEENQTFTFGARNGYNITFGAAAVNGGDNPSTFTNNMSGGTLTFTGAFWSNSDNAADRTLTIQGNGNTTISGNVTAAAAAYNHSITKSGTGVLQITSVAATLDGNLNVNGGTVQITDFRSVNMHDASSTNTGALNIGTTTTAGILTIGTATTATAAGLTFKTGKAINLAGTTGGATINASQSFAAPVILRNITSTGAGIKTLTLGGTSTQENEVRGVIDDNSLTNTTSLIKADAGTWVLTGANTYTGSTSILRGTLKLKNGASVVDILSATGAINLGASADVQNSGGTLELVGATSLATTEALGALTPVTGATTLRLTGSSAAANLTFTSLGAVANGVGVNVVTTAGVSGTVTVTGATNTNGIVNPQIYFNGADFAASTSGVLGAASYTTASGSLAASNTLPYLINSNIAQTANATINGGIKITGNTTTYTLNSSITTTIQAAANTAGGILVTGANAATITGGTGLSSGGTGTLAVRVDGSGDVLTIASPLTNGTTGGLTKNGAGVLILSSSANAQTGATNVNEGTLRLSGTGRLSAANITTNVRTGATLDLNGVGTGTAIAAFNGGGTVTNSSTTTAVLTVGNNNTGGTFSGIIQNGAATQLVAVTKAGSGTQTMSGLNTYTGVTTIQSSGLLATDRIANIGSASGIGAGVNTSTATNAASLVFTGTTGGLSYTGLVAASTDRLFTFNGSAASSGARIANNSSVNAPLSFTNAGALVFGASASVAQTLTLGGTSTADNVFAPIIADNVALRTAVTKNDAGTWFLTGANTYTGITSVGTSTNGSGILQAVDGTGLPTNSPLLLGAGTTGGGVFQTSGNFTRNLVATPAAGTGTVTIGATTATTAAVGFSAVGGKLTLAFGGLVSPTALTWGSGGFMGVSGTSTGAFVLNSALSTDEIVVANAINLNGSLRTIQVDDNSNTGADFATITGKLSGTGASGLVKTGSGVLRLTAANDYAGVTSITVGTLVVTSLGSSGGAGTSSVGLSGVTMNDSNAIQIGNATTGGAILQYVGPGETSDRKIRFNSTTGGAQIHADGAGALILTNVVNDYATPTGNKTLSLRGSSTAGNTISSNLTNDAGTPTAGTLAVTVDSGATWILSGTNTFSGALTVSAGAFGVGSNSATGTGSFIHTAGSVFASGADRTIGNAVYTTNNTTTAQTPTFIGDYSLTIANAWAHTNTTVSNTITNSIVSGKALTLAGGLTFNAITAARTATFNGTGETILNVGISSSSGFAVNTTYSGTGRLTLGGTINPNGGALTVSSGTVKLGANERIPDGATAANVTFSPAININAAFDLAGFSETINGLTANSGGNVTIDNSSSAPSTLTFGTNDAAVTFVSVSGANAITQTGGGAISLVKVGTGAANLTGALGNTGSTTVSGGTFTYNSTTGTTGLTVAANATLNLKGGLTTPASMTGVTLAGGGTLSLASGLGQAMDNLTTLSLGAGTGTAVLELDAGDTGTDTLTLPSGVATAQNAISLLIKDIDLSNLSQYTLISAPGGGLSGATYSFNLAGYTGSSLTTTDTAIILNTGTLVTSDVYWNGGGSTLAWNTLVTGTPDLTNFSSDAAGTLTTATLPGKGQKVIFIADNIAGGAALSTTLEQPFKINALQFLPSTTPANTPSSVTIAPGTLLSNSLTLAPSSTADGISLATGASATVTISAPIVASSAQTWTVTDSTQALNISGALSGAGNITKAGAGTLTLSSPGSGYTGAFAVNDGTVALTNVTALSGIAAVPGAGAAVTIGGTGAFYYNGTAGTVSNNLTFAGGTLSAGTAGQTYSGAVTVTSATTTTINLRDSNSATLTATSRNITLSGALSGTGAITLTGTEAASPPNGNQLTGDLVINNAASTWSGALNVLSGTAIFTNAANSGTATSYVGYDGIINFNQFGRVLYRNVNGASFTRTAAINFAANAVGEYHVDNVSSTLGANFTLTQAGAVNLNAASKVRLYLGDAGSNLVLSGGVTLNGDASFSVSAATGNDTDSLVTMTGAGFSGTGNLAINDDAGVAAWGQTNGNTRLVINAASTFSGNTSLSDGILVLGNKDALSTGSLTIAGVSTIQAGIALTGANALPNNVVLANTLTVSGSNSLALNGTLTNSGGNRTLTNSLTAGSLTLAGNVYLSELVGTGRTFTVNGAINTTISGAISNFSEVGGAAGGLTYAGTGELTLTGNNTYTGTTTLSSGAIVVRGNNVLGAASAPLSITTNATAPILRLQENGTAYNTTLTGTNSASIVVGSPSGAESASFTLGTLAMPAATLLVSKGSNITGTLANTAQLTFGAVTLSASTATFNVGANTTLILGAIGGNFITNKTGLGTLLLNSTSTRNVASAQTLTSGTLQLGNLSALGTAAQTMTINGGTASTLILAPTNDTAGTFNVTNLVISVANTAPTIVTTRGGAAGAGIINTIGTVSVGANGTNLTVVGGGIYDTVVSGANAVTSGTAQLTTGAITLTGSSTFTITNSTSGAATLLNNGSTLALGGANVLTLDGNGSFTQTGAISGATAGGGVVLGSGFTGVATFTGVSTATGGVTIKSGTAVANVSNATTVSGAFGLTNAGSNPVTLGDATANANSASLLANTFTVSNPINVVGVGAGTMTIGNNGALPAATVSNATAIVTAAAIFSGPITFAAASGTPVLNVTSTGTTGSTTLSGGVTGAGNLTLNANNSSGTGITLSTTSVNNTGTITNAGSGAGSVLISAVLGANVTGVIQNSTTSALSLSGANTTLTYDGVTNFGLNIRAGTVNALTSASALGAGRVTLGDTTALNANPASLLFGTNSLTFANPIVLADRSTAAGTLTIGITAATVGTILSGGVTGNNDFTVVNSTNGTTGRPSFTSLVNNSGTITLIGTNAATTAATTFSSIGSNVTGITVSSTGYTPLTVTALEVNSGGTTLTNSVSGAGTLAVLTVSGGITGTGNLILNNNNSSITNAIQLTTIGVNNTGTITNSGTGTSAVLISAVIGTNVTGVVQDSATSSLTLGAVANLWSGGLTIKAGTVIGGANGNTFGAEGNVISLGHSSGTANASLLASSGTFTNPINVVAGSSGNTLTIGNNGTTTAAVFGGAVTLSNALSIQATGTTGSTTLTGGITGTGDLTLRANNSSGTGITLSTTSINNTGSITNAGTGAASVSIDSVIGANVTGITQNSSTSALTLSVANTGFAGTTTLNAGSLTFSGGALGASGLITFTGTSTLRWSGHADDLSSRLVLTSGVTGTVDTNGNNVVFANAVGVTGGTAGVLRKAGSGSLTLNVAAAHTGGTELNAGTLNLGTLDALGSGTFTISGTSTFDNTSGAAGTLVGNPAQAWNGDFTFTGTNDLDLGTGAVTLGAARTVTVAANTLTVGGGISGPGFGLTKSGAGTLVLGGTNTYGGATAITNGTLRMAATGTLASTTAVTIANANNAATFDLNGTSQTIASLTIGGATGGAATQGIVSIGAGGTLTLGGNVTFTSTGNSTATQQINGGNLDLGGATRTFTVGNSTGAENDMEIGSVIQNGAFTKAGLGKLVLSGANTFAGNVTLGTGAGNLVITNSSGLGIGPKSVSLVDNTSVNSASIQLDGSGGNITLASDISWVTSSATGIGGIVNLAGDNTINGNFTLQAGGGSTQFTVNGGSLVLAGNLTPNTTGRFVLLNGTNGGTVSGVMQDGSPTNFLGLQKLGTGTWTITGANTYIGNTQIQAGSLRIAGADNRLLSTAAGGNFSVILGTGTTSAKLILGGDFAGGTGVGTQRNQTLTQNSATNVLTISGTGATNSVVGGADGGTSAGTPANNSVLTLNIGAGFTNTYAGLIGWDGQGAVGFQNNLNLVKSGAGTLVLSTDLSNWTGTGTGGNLTADATRPELILNGGILRLASTATVNTVIRNTGGIIDDQGFTQGANFFLITTGGLLTLNSASDTFAGAGITASSTGVVALNFDNTAVADYAGSSMYLGAVGARVFSGAALAAGSGNTYRFGGGSRWNAVGSSTVGGSGGNLRVTASNIITGANSVIIGDNGSYNDGLGLFGSNVSVEFTAAQNYTGTTTLAGGTLTVSNTNQLGSPAVVAGSIILDGGIFRYSGISTDISNRLTIDSGATIDTNGQSVTFASAFGNSDTGTSNGTTHPTTNGLGGLTKIGGGTLTLSGTNKTYAGTTTVSGGVLQLNGQTSTLASTSGLTFQGAGTFRFDNTGATATLNQTMGALTFAVGDGVILSQRTVAQSTNLTFDSLTPRTAGATGNFTLGGTGAAADVNKVIFSTAPATGTVLDAGLYFGGSDFASYDVAGYVRAFATTDATAAAVAAGTTMGDVAGKDVFLNGTITAQTSLSVNSLKIAGAFGLTLNSGQTLTIDSGGLIKTGATATITGGTLAAPGELVVRQSTSSDVLAIASTITAGSLTKSGAGTLTLSTSTNTFTGPITVNAGTLTVDSVNRIAGSTGITLDGGSFTISGNSTIARVFTVGLNGGTITQSNTANDNTIGTAGDSMLFNGLGARSLTLVGASDRVKTFNMAIGDNGGPTSLTLSGSGDTTAYRLAGANTYTGTTTITRGVLRLNAVTEFPGGLGGTTLTTANTGGGNLTFNAGSSTNRAILEVNSTVGDIYRSVGTGFNQIQWLGNGGFSNQTASTTRIVNLGGTGATLTWGSGSFVPTGSRLQFGYAGTNITNAGTIDFQNAIAFGTAARTVDVANGSAIVDAVLSGNLTFGAGGGIVLGTAGALSLTGVNNTGAATIAMTSGVLYMANASALPGASGAITLTGSATTAIVLGGSTNPVAFFNSRLASASTGAFGLDVNSSDTLDFSTGNVTNMRLAAFNPANVPVYFSGQITPGGSTYRFGGLAPIAGTNGLATTLVLARPGILTGARSVDIAPGNLAILQPQNHSAGTVINTVQSGGSSFVGVGADAALGSGTITVGGGNTAGFAPINGDRVIPNRFSSVQTGTAAFMVGADYTTDGLSVNLGQGALTFTGTFDLTGRTAAAVMHSRTNHAGIFLGNITGSTFGLTLNSSTSGLFGFLSDAGNGGVAKGFSGVVTLADNSNLYIDGNSSLGSGTSGITLNTSTLALQPATGTVTLTGRAITVNGDDDPRFVVYTGGNLVLTTGITNAAPTAARTLNKIGAGTLTLRGSNGTWGSAASFTNTLQVLGGKVVLEATASAFTAAADRFLNDAVALPLLFGAANATLGGGGTLEMVQFAENANTLTQAFAGTLTVNQGAHTLRLTNNSATAAATLSLGATFTRASLNGGTLNFASTTAGGANTFGSTNVGTNGIIGGWATFNDVDWATGSGTAITALNSYTTLPTSASSATVNYQLATNTTTTLTANQSINSLKLAPTGNSQVLAVGSFTLTNTSGGVIFDNTNGATTISGTGQIGATGSEVIVHTAGSGSGKLTLSAVVKGSATVLTKSGPGTLVLAGANTYTGSLFINAGTVEYSNATASNNLGNPTASATNIILNGGTLSYTGTTSNTLPYGITVNAQSTINVANAGGTLLFSPTSFGITGVTTSNTGTSATTGLVQKTGPGTLTISGGLTNTNLGVQVAAGAVNLAKTGVLLAVGETTNTSGVPYAALIVNNGASAKITGTGTDQIGNASSVVVQGTGFFDVNGSAGTSVAETFDGLAGNGVVKNTGSSAFTLTLGANNSSGISAYTVGAAHAAMLAGDSNISARGLNHFAGVIQDSIALTKVGSGTQILSGQNTYAGLTTISAGTLKLGADNALPNGIGKGDVLIAGAGTGAAVGGAANISSPGTLDLGGFNQTINGLNSVTGGFVTSNPTASANKTSVLTLGANDASGSFNGVIMNGYSVGTDSSTNTPLAYVGTIALTKTGNGILTLSGANTYTGDTTLSAGTLRAGNNAAFGTGTLNLNAGSLTSDGVTARTLANVVSVGGNIALGAATTNTGALTFNGAVGLGAAARTITANSDVTFAGGVTSTDANLTIGGAGDVTISTLGLNLGTGSLIMSGSGTLLLNVANTFDGATINSGTVKLGTNGTLGSGTINVALGAVLDLNGRTVGNTVVLASGATVTGGSLSAGTAPTTGTVGSVLTGTTLTKDDAGRLELTGANTYNGATTVNSGTVAVADFGNGTDPSPLGTSAVDNPANLVIGGATLEFTGATNTSTARSFTVAGNGTIAATGVGTLEFNSSSKINLTGENPTLSLFADNAGVNRLASTLADGSGLIKTLNVDGTGQWVLGGAVNRFRGDVRVDVNVNGGTFGFESGSLNGLNTDAVITVANGATLAWAGTNTKDVSDYLSVPAGTAKLDLGSNVVEMASVPTMGAGSSLSVIGGTLKVTVNSSTKFTDTAGTLIVNGTVGDVALASGGTLGGSGTVGDVTTVSGSVISPGNSPDTLTFTNWAPAGGTIIDWEVLNAGPSRVAGTDYDTIRVTGNLNLAGVTSVNRITIKVTSLDTILTDGPALNFNSPDAEGMMPRTFTLMTIEGSILNQSGSISDLFAFDFNDFDHTNLGAVNPNYWSVSSFEVGGDTQLIITAVPEPSTYGFGLGALALAAAAIRRRRKLKAEKKA